MLCQRNNVELKTDCQWLFFCEKKKRRELKKCEDNWVHILHFKGLSFVNDDSPGMEGVMYKIDGHAEKAMSDQLCHRSTEESKEFLGKLCPADKILKITGGNKLNSDGYQYKCMYFALESGNSEHDLVDFLEKEVIPAIMNTGMMRRDSCFSVKSHTVVNHMTDVVDYNDDLKHVIRSCLADEDGHQEGSYFKSSKNKLYYVFRPGCIPLEVMHAFDLAEEDMLPVDQQRQKAAMEEALCMDKSKRETTESGDSPNFNRSL